MADSEAGSPPESESEATKPNGDRPVRNESVKGSSIGDQAAETDLLGFKPYVDAIAEFLTDPETKAPLTLSVEGEWGSGKSSFMQQLKKAIEEIPRQEFEKNKKNKIRRVEKAIEILERKLFLWKKKAWDRESICKYFLDLFFDRFIYILSYRIKLIQLQLTQPKANLNPRIVEFNAWRHDKSESLWAAFAQLPTIY